MTGKTRRQAGDDANFGRFTVVIDVVGHIDGEGLILVGDPFDDLDEVGHEARDHAFDYGRVASQHELVDDPSLVELVHH